MRADISGRSSKDGDYDWDDGAILFLDGGDCEDRVPRDELYAYVTGKANAAR